VIASEWFLYSWDDIWVKLDLTTQAVLYTKTDSLCAAVTWALTNNTTVLFIDAQAYQGEDSIGRIISSEGKVVLEWLSWG